MLCLVFKPLYLFIGIGAAIMAAISITSLFSAIGIESINGRASNFVDTLESGILKTHV